MTKVALTGAGGFLGWHVRSALLERGEVSDDITVGRRFELAKASVSVSGAKRLLHIAGVNRGPDRDVEANNVHFAHQVAESIRRAPSPPESIVYANSTQAGNGTAYGIGKQRAGDILARVAMEVGSKYIDVRLPNLFGEHGRPFYNAVTATFCHLLAEGQFPTVREDKTLTLLHAQDAADLLLGGRPIGDLATLATQETVSGLLSRLTQISDTYRLGEIPDISDEFDRDLFNTYRSHVLIGRASIPLVRRSDSRGSFFEIVRAHGGPGQSSFSTTVPGVTRGDHFHRRKVERFTVLSGCARISMRRLWTTDVVTLDVDGQSPVAVDMPTMWAHNITNTGSTPLYTSFWTNDVFDPANPDTISEAV